MLTTGRQILGFLNHDHKTELNLQALDLPACEVVGWANRRAALVALVNALGMAKKKLIEPISQMCYIEQRRIEQFSHRRIDLTILV